MTLLSMLDRFEQATIDYERAETRAENKYARDELQAARRAIMEAFEARSASAEPVAWRVSNGGQAWTFRRNRVSGWRFCEPLYASPPASKREAELVKALEPFADIADIEDEVGRDDPDDDRVWVSQAYGCQLAELTIEEFRAARAAIHPSLEQE